LNGKRVDSIITVYTEVAMGLNIRSEEVNRLATTLAKRRKVSKTEAVRLAFINDLESLQPEKSVLEKVRIIQNRIASYAETGLEADKAFYDALNDEDDA
jgi:antitoxin VapB